MLRKSLSGTWDRGVSFPETYEKLRFMLISKSIENRKFSKSPHKLAKIAILFIALRNGARIGEAVAAYQKFIETGERIIEVEVEKKKRLYYDSIDLGEHIEIPTKRILRLMIIPEEVPQKLPQYKKTVNNISVFCYETLGHNAHSLRYSWITHLSKKGKSPQLIAKITKHSSLDQILHYTQQKEAENTLMNEVI